MYQIYLFNTCISLNYLFYHTNKFYCIQYKCVYLSVCLSLVYTNERLDRKFTHCWLIYPEVTLKVHTGHKVYSYSYITEKNTTVSKWRLCVWSVYHKGFELCLLNNWWLCISYHKTQINWVWKFLNLYGWYNIILSFYFSRKAGWMC